MRLSPGEGFRLAARRRVEDDCQENWKGNVRLNIFDRIKHFVDAIKKEDAKQR